jgi:sugar phosphate isomerase/epimerase
MVEEILHLGFERVELGHGVRLSLMEGIQKAYDAGKVKFSSLHNFCPLPVEINHAAPDCYEFSSHKELERGRAVRLSLQTIDFAARLGAPLVVLHLGRVFMPPITHQLLQMVQEGKQFSREYTKAKIEAVRVRERKAPLYLARVKECLKRIIEHAGEKGIKLGIEGRHCYEEIPSEREVPELLEEFNAPHVGYWHDFGHIQIKHNLGFLDHYEWLKKISPKLFGAHLHDTQWPGSDHHPPFTGGIEYDRLIPLLPKDCLFVWEMSPRRKGEAIVESLRKWKERFPQ